MPLLRQNFTLRAANDIRRCAGARIAAAAAVYIYLYFHTLYFSKYTKNCAGAGYIIV